jgi:hypothetical protein
MTINHLKTGAEPTPETLHISNIPHTMDNVQHSVPIMNQPLSQTFTEACLGNKHILHGNNKELSINNKNNLHITQ